MTVAKEIDFTLFAGETRRAIARLQDAMKGVGTALGKTISSFSHFVSALDDGSVTRDDRVYARRANRALTRSRRNTPTAGRVIRCPVCRTGRRLGWDEGPPCEYCGSIERDGEVYARGTIASASRKRRPHGRPR